MVNDKDRRAFADLEQRVLLSDPEWAARSAVHSPGPDAGFPTLAVLCAVLFVLVPPVFLLFGRLGLLLAVYAFFTAVVAVLIRRHRRS